MLRTIELEETTRVHHKIYVEYDNEEQLDSALRTTGDIDMLDDYIRHLKWYGIKVNSLNENCSEVIDSVEYYDDYMED